MIPDIRKGTALFEGSHTLPACPSDKSGIKMKISMEHYWNGTEKNPKYSKKTLSHFRFAHHQVHVD